MTHAKRILVVAPYCINTPHFETELEIIQRHLDDGDVVELLVCDADLKSCDVNIHHRRLTCARCKSRRKNGLALLDSAVRLGPIVNITPAQKKQVDSVVKLLRQGEKIQDIVLGNFDIGYGVLSSIISIKREPRPDFTDLKNLEAAESMIDAAASVYFTLLNKLSENSFDCVYVHNARFGILRAVLRACQAKDVTCFSHDRGSTLNKYALYENSLPHDRLALKQRIEQSWESADPVTRVAIGSAFFEDSRNAISLRWISHVRNQERGRLPESWDQQKTNIVIFNSSEDEFAAIGRSWENHLYDDQGDAVRKISHSCRSNTRLHFYLRVHPNLSGLSNSQIDEISSLELQNVTVISADSPISSYALLDKADKVISFGSTMGLEATFWGKPSILLANALYQDMGAAYQPSSHDKVISLLLGSPASKSKLSAIKYGCYVRTFGQSFEYYNPDRIYSGKFKGQYIKSTFYLEIVLKLERAVSKILKWISGYRV